MKLQVFLLLCCVLLISQTLAANILFFFSLGSKSHKLVHWPLAKALAARGHNVTIQSPFSKVEIVPNITEIHPQKNTEYVKTVVEAAVIERPTWEIQNYLMFPALTWMLVDVCALSVDKEESLIRQKPTFDLVIVDEATSDCGMALAHLHNASTVFISTPGYWPVVSMRSGNPSQISLLPTTAFPYLPMTSVWDRLINALTNLMLYIWRYYFLLPRCDDVLRREVSDDLPSLADLEKEVSLTLINHDFSMDHPRPYLPNIVEVGGMHCVPSKPLPQDLQSFFDGSGDDGFIYFSFGTFIQPAHCPQHVIDTLVRTFALIPQRVVWKWKGGVIPGLSSNVITRDWLPQQDILGHPKIRLVITHGGLLSQQEAVCKGVPILTVPFFFDQFLNAHNAERLGYGQVFRIEDMTGDLFYETIVKMTNDPSFQESAKRISGLYHDKTETAVDRAVFWTEYVLRHKGANHLKSAARYSPIYQLYLLDVMAIVLVVIVLTTAATVYVTRAIWRKLTSTKKSKISKSSAKKRQ